MADNRDLDYYYFFYLRGDENNFREIVSFAGKIEGKHLWNINFVNCSKKAESNGFCYKRVFPMQAS